MKKQVKSEGVKGNIVAPDVVELLKVIVNSPLNKHIKIVITGGSINVEMDKETPVISGNDNGIHGGTSGAARRELLDKEAITVEHGSPTDHSQVPHVVTTPNVKGDILVADNVSAPTKPDLTEARKKLKSKQKAVKTINTRK